MTAPWVSLLNAGEHAALIAAITAAAFLMLVTAVTAIAALHPDRERRRDARKLLHILLASTRRE